MRTGAALGIFIAILPLARPAQAGPPADSLVSVSDVDFLRAAAAAHAAEIKLGELARQRALSADIRKLGRKAAEEHFRGLARVVPLLVDHDDFHDQRFPAHSFEYEQLATLSDDAFDAEYWRVALSHQQTLIIMFKKRAASASNGEVAAYATQAMGSISRLFSSAQAISNPYPVIPKSRAHETRNIFPKGFPDPEVRPGG